MSQIKLVFICSDINLTEIFQWPKHFSQNSLWNSFLKYAQCNRQWKRNAPRQNEAKIMLKLRLATQLQNVWIPVLQKFTSFQPVGWIRKDCGRFSSGWFGPSAGWFCLREIKFNFLFFDLYRSISGANNAHNLSKSVHCFGYKIIRGLGVNCWINISRYMLKVI